MNATEIADQKIIPIPTAPARTPDRAPHRFSITAYTNPRTGSQSWRVSGIKRNGTRIRANYSEEAAARCRHIELETEWLKGESKTEIRATKLSEKQIALAEAALARLEIDEELPLAIEYWLNYGRQKAVRESPRLDDAVEKFNAWLEKSSFRDRTQSNLRLRVKVFTNSIGNLRIADITPDIIYGYLEARSVAKASKDNDRRALSRFFAWCIERPQKWITTNPARKETRERRGPGASSPSILTVGECEKLLRSAENHRGGRLAPYVAICLFGGLRPFEARRIAVSQINLADGEIRLEGLQTKTGSPRVITICPTLRAWIKAFQGKPFYPANWRRDFDIIKTAAGYGNPDRLSKALREKQPSLKPWPDDVMRHTAISHYFRETGSYGRTAEQFGNSEAIIKKHYQGRVSSEDTKAFYALMPTKKGNR
jgi:integrase